jgi:hypothetical protein
MPRTSTNKYTKLREILTASGKAFVIYEGPDPTGEIKRLRASIVPLFSCSEVTTTLGSMYGRDGVLVELTPRHKKPH